MHFLDVRGLLSDDSLINDTAPATFREWNTDQMLQVKSPKGNHEVCIQNQVNEFQFCELTIFKIGLNLKIW